MSTQHKFFVGDNVLFAMVFKVKGVEQLPLSGVVAVFEDDGKVAVASTAAVISGNEIRYQFDSVQEGNFKLYFTPTFATPGDKRTDIITYSVSRIDGLQS